MSPSEAEQALSISGYRFERPQQLLINDLEKFQSLLNKWQKVQNLVSRETLSQFWSRHVADSLQLLNYIPATAKHIVMVVSKNNSLLFVLTIRYIRRGTR